MKFEDVGGNDATLKVIQIQNFTSCGYIAMNLVLQTKPASLFLMGTGCRKGDSEGERGRPDLNSSGY